MRSLLSVLFVLLCPALTAAQTPMMITVEADRVVIGSEFLPRLLDLPAVLVVATGASVTLPAAASYDYVEVAGTLILPAGSRLSVTHLVVLPGGRFRAEPGSELLGHVVALDLRDVHQWGNGLVNFGRVELLGTPKTAWTTATAAIPAGAVSVTVVDATGWQVGDELVIADMGTPQLGELRREPTITIMAITGTTITLGRPLEFAHDPVRTPDGAVIQLPYVANVTRDTVIRSEVSTALVRWHTANVGHAASWDIQYVEFRDLGRTTTAPLHPQTNHVGRYPMHNHHATGMASRLVGSVLRRGPKWLQATHNTSDSLVAWNVGVDAGASCFVTEDGNEFRNVIDHNFCAYSVGVPGIEQVANEVTSPGSEGSGFWFRGVGNTITDNVSINNAQGFNLFNRPAVSEHCAQKPILHRGNVAIANRVVGHDLWCNRHDGPLIDFVGANQPDQIVIPIANNSLTLINPLLVNGKNGISGGANYAEQLTVEGGQILGHVDTAIAGGGARILTMRNTVLQNGIDIDQRVFGMKMYFEGVRHLPWPGHVQRPIMIGPDDVGFSRDILPPMTDSHIQIVSHQGIVGQDFFLYDEHQRASAPVNHFVPREACGATAGPAWETCGIAFGGGVIYSNEEVPLPELASGFARRASAPRPLGPPRAVVMWPNRQVPQMPTFGIPLLLIQLTGDGSQAGPNLVVQWENDPPILVTPASTGDHPTQRKIMVPNVPGEHTVQTWRMDLAGDIIPSSRLVFTYCTDAPCGGPPPPVEEVCGNGLDDDGDGQIDEGCPINCVVSSWTLTSSVFSPWTHLGVGGTQTRTDTYTRTILTAASNGGAACPVN